MEHIASYVQYVGITVFLVQCRLYVYKDICLYVLYTHIMSNFMIACVLLNISKNNSGLKGLLRM